MLDISTFIAQHKELNIATTIIILLLILVEWMRAKRKSLDLNPQQVIQKINHEHAILIDVRTQASFQQAHIIHAQSIPSAELKQSHKKLEKYRKKPLIIICQAGVESRKVASQLKQQGFNAYSLANGMRGWINADMPIIKENKA